MPLSPSPCAPSVSSHLLSRKKLTNDSRGNVVVLVVVLVVVVVVVVLEVVLVVVVVLALLIVHSHFSSLARSYISLCLAACLLFAKLPQPVLPDFRERLGPNILLERARFVILFTESQKFGGQIVNKIFSKNGPNSK